MRILLSGALGRMGRAVAQACRDRGIDIACGVDVAACADHVGFPVYPSFDACREQADVLVDFTRPELLPDLLAFALKQSMPAVLATTGYNEADMGRIQSAAERIPIFQSANMSLGVNLLRALIRKAATVLGEGFDVEIVERHHNRKIDAPSGTALMLFEELSRCYPGGRELAAGRQTRTQARDHREIGVHAVRGGTLAGSHEVGFYGPEETLTLIHDAQSRAVFAQGAARAAAFLKGKPAGLYGMDALIQQLQGE